MHQKLKVHYEARVFEPRVPEFVTTLLISGPEKCISDQGKVVPDAVMLLEFPVTNRILGELGLGLIEFKVSAILNRSQKL